MHHGFSPHVERLVDLALEEDLTGGDVTTAALFDGSERSRGRLVAKAPLVLAGADVFAYVLDRVASLPGAPPGASGISFDVADGSAVEAGTNLAAFEGPTVTLLRAERLGLNLLQRMCGIATKARAFQQALGDAVRITDTRKTTPGMRELERHAVRVGGGANHRYNLAGGVLIKENHIRAAGGIAVAIDRARRCAPHSLRIEIEVTNLDEMRNALAAGADIIMLDNMPADEMREAVAINAEHADETGRRAVLEASGNVTLERLPELGSIAGLDFVSSGALTHSAPAADISMLFEQGAET